MTRNTLAAALAGLLAAGLLFAGGARAAEPLAMQPCRLKGLAHEARCGVLQRALDPSRPGGPRIDVHVAVVPALARHHKPDPVFFFAGGPGQSAIELAGAMAQRFARLNNHRDLVFIDQRGTGRSAPLKCPDDDPRRVRPMAETASLEAVALRLDACRAALQKLPHGDLRFYTTTLAMADADAVRAALGAERVNLVGGSYGTRAALEYLRQFPQRVRRAVLDGVAPPDMVLPASFAADNQAALDALLAWCDADAPCKARHPALRRDLERAQARLPETVELAHPATGVAERVAMPRDALAGLLRSPLYAPFLASALPAAIGAAADGRWQPLVTLASALTGQGDGIASGMHFSVVCAEDAPRMGPAADAPGAVFADSFAQLYRRVCAGWPRGEVPPAFYAIPAAPTATLLLSGGLDPATPPRHAERVASALGPKARHVVVPAAGHGTMGLPCLREPLARFVDAETDDAALAEDFACAAGMPRPPVFVPPGAAPAPAPGASR